MTRGPLECSDMSELSATPGHSGDMSPHSKSTAGLRAPEDESARFRAALALVIRTASP